MSCPVHLAFRRRLPNWVQYDWLGNQTATDDDSHGFYDRSLGKVTNNTASQKPYQLAGAEQTTGTKTGALATKYDDAGNLVAMAVRRDGSCYPEGAVCSQQYRYRWDEVGRLVEAKRWDVQGPSLDSEPVGQAAAHLRYGYDASDNRVIKTATDDQGEQVHTVYIFGSLELRRAQFDAVESPNDYTDDIDTEVGYLFGNGVRLARLHWDDNGSPAVGGANLHVLFELGDHLGSSSKVLDKSTSELVEASTYMGYGQAESDYRPGRWKGFREDYRFTGKEEDSEVGLTYFGKRFLSSALGRWVSADPLAIQSPGQADLNVYAYVHGLLLRAVDLKGLAPTVVEVGMITITKNEVIQEAGVAAPPDWIPDEKGNTKPRYGTEEATAIVHAAFTSAIQLGFDNVVMQQGLLATFLSYRDDGFTTDKQGFHRTAETVSSTLISGEYSMFQAMSAWGTPMMFNTERNAFGPFAHECCHALRLAEHPVWTEFSRTNSQDFADGLLGKVSADFYGEYVNSYTDEAASYTIQIRAGLAGWTIGALAAHRNTGTLSSEVLGYLGVLYNENIRNTGEIATNASYYVVNPKDSSNAGLEVRRMGIRVTDKFIQNVNEQLLNGQAPDRAESAPWWPGNTAE